MKQEDFFTSSVNRGILVEYVEGLFKKMINLPTEIRPDDKERTGVQMFVRKIGTRSMIFESIYQPSENAHFFAAEKAVRSAVLGHATSQNSQNPGEMEFAGSITVLGYQFSISGLKADEDVFISIAGMAKFLDVSMQFVIINIQQNGGMLPECVFDQNAYHWQIL
ncbi:MAG: hypothetical protein AAB438_00510 [Patescibacteria group bacterium]